MGKLLPPRHYVCVFPSTLIVQCESLLGNHSDGMQQQTNKKSPQTNKFTTTQGNRNQFSYAKLMKMGKCESKHLRLWQQNLKDWTCLKTVCKSLLNEFVQRANEDKQDYLALLESSHSACSWHECCQSEDISKLQITEHVEKMR